ncbi:VWA domain-containing protein [Streptococcus sp. ZY19097]|uniref:VWA domain-containing protein n=1 Tax=Streptococcus sp. ZY19097 TaxID=3231906 RepID=UPI0034594E1D
MNQKNNIYSFRKSKKVLISVAVASLISLGGNTIASNTVEADEIENVGITLTENSKSTDSEERQSSVIDDTADTLKDVYAESGKQTIKDMQDYIIKDVNDTASDMLKDKDVINDFLNNASSNNTTSTNVGTPNSSNNTTSTNVGAQNSSNNTTSNNVGTPNSSNASNSWKDDLKNEIKSQLKDKLVDYSTQALKTGATNAVLELYRTILNDEKLADKIILTPEQIDESEKYKELFKEFNQQISLIRYGTKFFRPEAFSEELFSYDNVEPFIDQYIDSHPNLENTDVKEVGKTVLENLLGKLSEEMSQFHETTFNKLGITPIQSIPAFAVADEYVDFAQGLTKTAVVALEEAFNYIEQLQNLSQTYIDSINSERESVLDADKRIIPSDLFADDESQFIIKPTEDWKHGSESNLLFEIKNPISQLSSVYVNGVELHKDDYLLREGSTIIELKSEYLNRLYDGKYTLTSVFKVGNQEQYINTNFNVRRPEDNYIIPEKEKIHIVKNLESIETNNLHKLNQIILLLDASGSMSGEALEKEKEATKKIVTDLLKKGNSEIAIIRFADYAWNLSSFSSDEDYLRNSVDDLFALGGTNYSDALKLANDMFNEYGKTDSVKSIIFITDGIPTDGIIEEGGRFSQSDHLYAGYANGAISLKESFNNRYNIYTVGLFNSLEVLDSSNSLEEEKKYAESVVEALSTVDSFSIDTLEDLEGTINKVIELNNNSVDMNFDYKLISNNSDNLVYKITAQITNQKLKDSLKNNKTQLKLLTKGKIVEGDDTQLTKQIDPNTSKVVEWIVKLVKDDYNNTSKVEFSVSHSADNTNEVSKIAYFTINNHKIKDQSIEIDIEKLQSDIINPIIESEVKKNVDNLFKSDFFDRLIYIAEENKIGNTGLHSLAPEISKGDAVLNEEKPLFEFSKIKSQITQKGNLLVQSNKSELKIINNRLLEQTENPIIYSSQKSSVEVKQTYSRVAQRHSLPKTGDKDSLLYLAGISLLSLLGITISHKKKFMK